MSETMLFWVAVFVFAMMVIDLAPGQLKWETSE